MRRIILPALIAANLTFVPALIAGPPGAGAGGPINQDVEKRVAGLMSKMTLEEKLDFLGGTNWYFLQPIEHLGIPQIKTSDGPVAARNDGPTTAYPGGIALAATWDRALAERIGVGLGRDSRARGVHILLAPAINIYRAPMCGRNFEYMGEDPVLAGEMCVPVIKGIQSQGVMATIKHFACNNTEADRRNLSSEVDERTLHEIYLPAFKQAVQQGNVACLMTAYNLLNGTHCSENDLLINQILKHDWGFAGIVMSDWDSTYNGVNAANGGLDLEMPTEKFMNKTTLLPAIKAGLVKESTIDDKIRRLLRGIVSYGFLDRPQVRADIPKNDPENARVALDGAREAIVLLKNERNVLPLERKSIKTLAVLGPNAEPAVYAGGGSAFPDVFSAISVADGVRRLAGEGIKVIVNTNADAAVMLAKQCDAVIFCAGFNWRLEGEDYDRPYPLPPGQSELIQAVAAANRRTVVVLNSGGGVDWTNWLEKVPALVEAWYPGQAGGRAVAEILFGDVNPSGKLPATFEKFLAQNPTMPQYSLHENQKTYYTEGIFVGYRGYDAKKLDPQFCFGHGLSYTTFSYGGVKLSSKKIPAGGAVTVSVEIKNTGKRAGDEIVQIYTHQEKSSVPRPPKELKGFERVSLEPGEKKVVNLTVMAEQLGFYDVKTHGFVTEPGTYQIMAGSSSRDIRGSGKLEVTAAPK